MSVIKIPSQHIYSIDNQKVLTNQIDKIEVQTYVPQLISATENVYTESVKCIANWEAKQSKSEHKERTYNSVQYTAYAYMDETPSYITKTFIIPKTASGNKIVRILTEANDNGQPNIKYNIRGDIISGIASGSVSFSGPVLGSVDYKDVIVNRPSNLIKTEDTSFSLTPNISYTYDYYALGIVMISPTVNFVLTDRSTILTATAKENKDNFTITLTILNGLKTTKMGGGTTTASYGENPYQLTGEYQEYIPKQVDVSFYGDVIKLDLQNETIIVGDENGKAVQSFSGNELMQSTNVPSVEATHNDIIRQYKKGKEVATIRCGIEDFYADSGEVDISIVGGTILPSGQEEIVIESIDNVVLNIGDKIYFDNGGVAVIVAGDKNFSYWAIMLKGQSPQGLVSVQRKRIYISKNRENELPMTFNIGDTSIPYVYGANGKDKPMSIYKNGTPKEFEVLGKKIIYDGAIWQELTEQEQNPLVILPYEYLFVFVVATSDMSNGQKKIDVWVKTGELAVGDIIEYDGEQVKIDYITYASGDTAQEYPVAIFFAPNNSKFLNALEKTITVKKITY